MTTFWILAAGLAGLAVLFALAPLLAGRGASGASDSANDDQDIDRANLDIVKQKLAELDADLASGKLDQGQYDAARQDLEREALTSVGTGTTPKPGLRLPGPALTALALAFAIPASALLLYLAIGNGDLIPRLQTDAMARAAEGSHGGPGMPALDELVTRLEQRLEQHPDDAQGWIMLGRTYFTLRDTAKAETAMERAHKLLPENTEILLAYAEAVAANNGNDLTGRPSELIDEALRIDPEDVSARWLSGMAAFQRGQYNAAAVAWKKVLPQLDPSTEDAQQLRGLIAQAEQRAGVPAESRISAAEAPATGATGAVAQAAEPAAATGPEAAAAAIDVDVSLAPELASRADPDTMVFVYAKAASGPPMPLAVQRLRVSDLPAKLRLDDSMAMMPAMKLSSFPKVIVGARVSPSGQAMPQSGDLSGETGPVPSSGSEQVAVLIDKVVP